MEGALLKERRSRMHLVHALLGDRLGASAVEYGLIAALIAVSLIAGATGFSDSLSNIFNGVEQGLSGASD